jgi:predicted lipoprotein with Yx(FWY)xxD motif
MKIHSITRLRAHGVVLAAIALGALALAGCATATPTGGPSSGTGPSATSAAGGGLTVKVATTPGGVMYLADGSGQSLYLFVNDTAGKSTCNGVCAAAWPPLAGSATAATGLMNPLTTTTRDDGTSQAVYNGHPLYYYQVDRAAGQTNGEGANSDGGLWYLVDPTGNAIMSLTAGASASSPEPKPAGGGY